MSARLRRCRLEAAGLHPGRLAAFCDDTDPKLVISTVLPAQTKALAECPPVTVGDSSDELLSPTDLEWQFLDRSIPISSIPCQLCSGGDHHHSYHRYLCHRAGLQYNSAGSAHRGPQSISDWPRQNGNMSRYGWLRCSPRVLRDTASHVYHGVHRLSQRLTDVSTLPIQKNVIRGWQTARTKMLRHTTRAPIGNEGYRTVIMVSLDLPCLAGVYPGEPNV